MGFSHNCILLHLDANRGLQMAEKKKPAGYIVPSKRRKIYKAFHKDERKINDIMEEFGVTYWQVYRIISGNTKIDGSPRTDKGKSRKSVDANGKVITAKWTMDDFTSMDEFQLFVLMDSLSELANEYHKMDVVEKVKLIREIERIQTAIYKRQLKDSIRRPDAEVISRIIKHFQPEASDQDVIKIYKEISEIYLRERTGVR